MSPVAQLSVSQKQALRLVDRWLDEHGSPDGETVEFEAVDVGVSPATLTTLIFRGYLERGQWTNRHHFYRRLETPRELPDVDAPEHQEWPEEEIPADLFDAIVGYPEEKAAFMRVVRDRLRVHQLMIGEIGTAKTLFTEAILRLPGTVEVQGGSASGPGLRDLIVNDQPDHIVIDQIDYLKEGAQRVLIPILEGGRIRSTLHGMRVSRETRATVWATANDADHLALALLSRFHKWVFPPYSQSDFIAVLREVLYKGDEVQGHTNQERADFAHFIAVSCWTAGIHDAREARHIARMYRTEDEVTAYLASPHRWKPPERKRR